jgi:histo-blood group ABO system transferase
MNDKKLERVLHNFYIERAGGVYNYQDILTIREFLKHIVDLKKGKVREFKLPKYKVGLMFICLNEPYWQFAKDAIEGAAKYFLPDHEVECLLWSDMPESKRCGATLFETEPVEWPFPTLFRYHLFLNQEDRLKKFDYVFYCDLDMRFVNIVGDEVLGAGLTAALHPGYAVDKKFVPPYEPDVNSTAFIERPGKVIDDGGKPRFMPMYFAGGFQGGRTKDFIKAMKVMKKNIDKDLNLRNYIAIWNDESHWNKYLFANPPEVVLTPSYIYPDSLINEYYVPLWGRDYPPKLVTLTKKFTTSAEGGVEARKMIDQLKHLKK